jgi:hypothetical protein
MSALRDQRHLTHLLEDELGFYRTLFVLMDRQRDWFQSDAEHCLIEGFAALREVRGRIEASEGLIARARQRQEQAFDAWARSPEILDLQERIAELVGQCHEVAADCERMARNRLAAYRTELAQMEQGRRLLKSFATACENPRFVDERP